MINPMSKLKIALASGTLALCMLPNVGWSTRLVAAPVAGQITALPGGHEIEVANHMYHVKQGSAAEKAMSPSLHRADRCICCSTPRRLPRKRK